MSDLKDTIIIDGLVVSKFSRELFEDMARGGVTAANCTCSVWENFSQTMANISQWNQW
jgi:membrane dipeptidase